MKKLCKKVTNAANGVVGKMEQVKVKVGTVLGNTRGENYVDSGVKILIAVVLGALLLAGLYALFNDTIMPTITQRIIDMFNYAG